MITDLRKKIAELARQVADRQGVEVFDVELLGKGKMLMRITIDSERGITLDDCEYFSKSLGALLDVEDPVRGPYTLEVSSPGLDRPLRSPGDFERNIGKLARVITMDKIDNQNFFVGRITGIHGTLIKLSVHDREIEIPFENISKARLEIEL